ncbi:9533_t:CDS:2 [Entrophospora sp. SA101]|nr:9533_t:CDS:2 [Entrophospora sp. SA101]
MESSIVSVLDSLINTDGVKGVLVTDKHGLCLGGSNEVDPNNKNNDVRNHLNSGVRNFFEIATDI